MIYLAQATVPGGGLITFLPLIFLVIWMFWMFRRQKKTQNQVQTMQNSIKIGDRVTTIGGLVGTVTQVYDDNITVDVGGANIVIKKWGIRGVDGQEI